MIINGQTVSGLELLLKQIESDLFMCALYTDRADLDMTTRHYLKVGEVSGPGYDAGGKLLTGVRVLCDGHAAVMDFDDPVWPNSTLSARGALIYDRTRGNCALTVIDFGEIVSSKNGNFRLPLPQPTAEDGIYRLVLGS